MPVGRLGVVNGFALAALGTACHPGLPSHMRKGIGRRWKAESINSGQSAVGATG